MRSTMPWGRLPIDMSAGIVAFNGAPVAAQGHRNAMRSTSCPLADEFGSTIPDPHLIVGSRLDRLLVVPFDPLARPQAALDRESTLGPT
jgi:hypothetical protein